MKEASFISASKVVDTIEQAGFEAYIVGGAVRDILLNRAVHDIDIATSAHPPDIMNIFPKTFPTGIEHGTVLVRFEKQSFEITTFRKETGYTDYRRPDRVNFVTSLEEDLARRDFTINAMAFTKDKELIDPFNGKNDLSLKIIRTVGDPSQRFTEDGLRMMRAIRFSAQLNFQIETTTIDSIKKNAHLLNNISVERLADEWKKIIEAVHMKKALLYVKETNLSRYLPILKSHEDVLDILIKQDSSFSCLEEYISFVHLSYPSVSVTDWIREWKLSNRVKKASKLLVEVYKQYEKEKIEWIVYQIPDYLIQSFSNLVKRLGHTPIENFSLVKESLSINSRSDLVINGTDLIRFYPNKRPGTWLQTLLSTVEKKVVLGELTNDKMVIGEWLKEWEQNGIN